MTDDLVTRLPPENTQCRVLLEALSRGERLTVAEALDKYRCYALSQRMGDLRRKYHWPVKDEWYQVKPGTQVKRYYLPHAL